MTSVTASLPGFPAPRDTGQRLTLSLALSVAAHLVVIAMLAGLLKPLEMLGHVESAIKEPAASQLLKQLRTPAK